MKNTLTIILVSVISVFLVGCNIRAQQGGKASYKSSHDGVSATFDQPENPATDSSQNLSERRVVETPLPAKSEIKETIVYNDEKGKPVEKTTTIITTEPTTRKEVIERTAETKVGSSWKDTAREIGATIKSMSGLIYLGALLLIFGVVSIFYPPLKAIVNSVTTSLSIAACGIAMMCLPALIADPKVRMMIGVGVIAGVVFIVLLVRNAHKQGFIDANKDGIDDRQQ